MEINATLIGQMITFAIFVWFTMRYVWPVLQANLKLRQERIAEGLSAAERGHHELGLAQKKAIEEIRNARKEAHHIIELAHKQAATIVEEATAQGLKLKEKLLEDGGKQMLQEKKEMAQGLEKNFIDLVVLTSEKLLKRALTEQDKKILFDMEKVKFYD